MPAELDFARMGITFAFWQKYIDLEIRPVTTGLDAKVNRK
jgi:hypothetical protein